MKRILSMLLVVIMLFGTLCVLTACGEPKDDGAEISVYLGDEVFDFDPTDYYVDSNAEQVMSLIFEPLFKINKKGELGCAAAKKYSVNEKERKIVINLRESYWSDEVRVKASDFIYAWRDIILEPNNPNPAVALFYDIENAVKIKNGEESLYSFGAVASDTYEITITYREGANYKQLLKNLASVSASPLREDIVSVAKSHWSKSMTTIVTNGPFKIEALNHELGDFTLARNLGFHQKPTAKKYTDKVNPASLISFFTKDGELELTYADIAEKTVFYMGDATLEDRKNNESKATVASDFSTYTYVFNTDNPLFANKNVRKALSLALNRQAIAEAVTFGNAATGFLPNPVAKSVYGKKIDARIAAEAAMDEAKSLINSANLGSISKSFTLTVNDDEESVAIAELAKVAWQELGFNVTVKKVGSVSTTIKDTSTSEDITIQDSAIQALVKEASYGKRDFDVIAVDWQMYSNDAFVALSAFTSHMNGNGKNFSTGALNENISGWTNADYDSYMNAAYAAKNDKERKAALAEAEKILLDSCPVIPVLYNESFAFISKDLSKVSIDAFGNFSFTGAKQKNYRKYLESESE